MCGFFLDRGYGTCEIDWAKASYSTIYKSYIISILVCCFFVPVLVMLFCYVSIINTVKRGNALSSEGDLTDRQRKIERDVTIVSSIIYTAALVLDVRSGESGTTSRLTQQILEQGSSTGGLGPLWGVQACRPSNLCLIG